MAEDPCVADGFVGWGGGGRVKERQNRRENGAGTTRNVFISPLICTRGFIAHLCSPDKSARYAGSASSEIRPYNLRSL